MKTMQYMAGKPDIIISLFHALNLLYKIQFQRIFTISGFAQ